MTWVTQSNAEPVYSYFMRMHEKCRTWLWRHYGNGADAGTMWIMHGIRGGNRKKHINEAPTSHNHNCVQSSDCWQTQIIFHGLRQNQVEQTWTCYIYIHKNLSNSRKRDANKSINEQPKLRTFTFSVWFWYKFGFEYGLLDWFVKVCWKFYEVLWTFGNTLKKCQTISLSFPYYGND